MKRNRLFLIIATTVVLGCTTSCSRGDDIAATDGEHRTPISFNVGIGSAATPDVTTRGYTTGEAYNSGYTFQAGDIVTIGITGVSGSSRSTETEDIKQYTVAEGTSPRTMTYSKDADGVSRYGFDWLSQSERVSIRAWGYGNGTTPATDPHNASFSISTTQNTDASIKELLYSPADNYDNGNINIPLYHQCARIVVKINDDKAGTPTIADITIGHDSEGNKIPTSGTFAKPGSGNLGSWSSQGNLDVITPKLETTVTGYDYIYSAVVIPGDGTIYQANKRLINIKIGEEWFVYRLPSATPIEPGKQYTFDITVKNQTINVETSITDWNAVTSTPSAQLSPDDIKKNPLWYVEEFNMTNPHTSTQLTVGTTANQGYYYTWADAMRLFSTNNTSAGESDYYNGGRYVEGEPTGTTWHLPTNLEWNSIFPTCPHNGYNLWSIAPNVGDAKKYAELDFSTDVCFGYNSETKGTGGTYLKEVSYWYRHSDNILYAIRYCGTDYCSAWKYEWTPNDMTVANPGCLTVSSTLLGLPYTISDAESMFGTTIANWNTIYFGDNEAKGALTRLFYARNSIDGASGPTAADDAEGANLACYWASTLPETDASIRAHCVNAGYHASAKLLTVHVGMRTTGRNVRLFRDNNTDARPAPVCTVDQILAGISTDYEIGDVVCQDGSIYRYDGTNNITARALAEKAGRKPIGVIVYKCAASPSYTDLQVTEGMGHALVMGIDDISTTAYAWSGSEAATGKENESYGSPDLFPNVMTGDATANCFAQMRGLEKTHVLANHLCNASHEHPAFEAIKTWREQTANQVDFAATDWFVPSMGQWLNACSAMIARQGHTYTPIWVGDDVSANTEDVVQIISTEAGAALKWGGSGDYYQSSTEGGTDEDKVVAIGFAQGGSGHSGIRFGVGPKEAAYYVRPFLAF